MKPRKLLLISYYFPPCGGAAVQRWLRFLPFLVDAGYEVHVLAPKDGDFPYTDESLVAKIPKEVWMHHTSAPKIGKWWQLFGGKEAKLPHGDLSVDKKTSLLERLLLWVRLNLIFPDLRVFWLPTAIPKACQLHRIYGFDLVISTGPPHSSHLIGLHLKRKFKKIKWIADWRDPWSEIYYLKLQKPLPHARFIQRYLQNKVLKSADLNLLISRYLMERLPDANKLLLRNGYDLQAVEVAKQAAQKQANTFLISYVGQFTMGQDISFLLDVLEAVMDENDVKIRFIGSNVSAELSERIQAMDNDKFELLPFMPHQQALKHMAASNVLLLLINRYEGYQGMLTTKLFEYLGVGVPILALGPRGGEAEELIQAHQAGAAFDADQVSQARDWLRWQHQLHQSGNLASEAKDSSSLSSLEQSKILLNALSNLLNDPEKSECEEE